MQGALYKIGFYYLNTNTGQKQKASRKAKHL
jgi:hypothetical protein